MNPKINFQHVLNELSVNRSDPCEVLRELISNSYDAVASNIFYTPIQEHKGFLYFDDGIGLSRTKNQKGVSPYQAFFSIGESTKLKNEGIGYKCQGSKLTFACGRFLVVTKTKNDNSWFYKQIENPRNSLTLDFDITPSTTHKPWDLLRNFSGTANSTTEKSLAFYDESFFKNKFNHGTLIFLLEFDSENFKNFLLNGEPQKSHVYNYIRHCTIHGDVRCLTVEQGFKPTVSQTFTKKVKKINFQTFNGKNLESIPFGFPYLYKDNELDFPIDYKSPVEVSRLSEGRFYGRFGKRIEFSGSTYSFILAIDGNRRAHEKYDSLDRRGKIISGIKLAEQRGVFIASSGIKICNFTSNLFANPLLNDYAILNEADASIHYLLIIEGQFDLVTNRNALSRNSYNILENSDFIKQIEQFLSESKNNSQSPVFNQLLQRLKREHSADKRDQQITQIKEAKLGMMDRERFRVNSNNKATQIYVSPMPGEEYMVGVLYASLGRYINFDNEYYHLWHRVISFSTQGIDSIGMIKSEGDLSSDNLSAIEYKYAFSHKGPFNHALITVDLIIAWNVNLVGDEEISDEYGCFGSVVKDSDGFWTITDIEDAEGNLYEPHKVKVISLRDLIQKSFPNVRFSTPPSKKVN